GGARRDAREPDGPAVGPQGAGGVEQAKTGGSAHDRGVLVSRTTVLVPIFEIQGLADQLVPEVEGVSMVNKLRAHGWPVKVAVADVGHPIAQNKAAVWSVLNAQANAFLDHYLKGSPAAALDASAQVTSCAPRPGRIYRQPDWAGLAPDRVVFDSTTPQVTTSATADPSAPLTDPIIVAAAHAGKGACVSVRGTVPPA